VARFVTHPAIDFSSPRRSAPLPRLGLPRDGTVFHSPRRSSLDQPSVLALRPQTSRFSYAVAARANRVPATSAAQPFGPPRARRA
jgi:hypothetical protein